MCVCFLSSENDIFSIVFSHSLFLPLCGGGGYISFSHDNKCYITKQFSMVASCSILWMYHNLSSQPSVGLACNQINCKGVKLSPSPYFLNLFWVQHVWGKGRMLVTAPVLRKPNICKRWSRMRRHFPSSPVVKTLQAGVPTLVGELNSRMLHCVAGRGGVRGGENDRRPCIVLLEVINVPELREQSDGVLPWWGG